MGLLFTIFEQKHFIKIFILLKIRQTSWKRSGCQYCFSLLSSLRSFLLLEFNIRNKVSFCFQAMLILEFTSWRRLLKILSNLKGRFLLNRWNRMRPIMLNLYGMGYMLWSAALIFNVFNVYSFFCKIEGFWFIGLVFVAIIGAFTVKWLMNSSCIGLWRINSL